MNWKFDFANDFLWLALLLVVFYVGSLAIVGGAALVCALQCAPDDAAFSKRGCQCATH